MRQTLAELRHKKSLTQRSLATKLSKIEKDIKFSPTSIALYELGLRTPSLQKAKLIARYFEIPVENIIFGPSAYKVQATAGEQTTIEIL